MDIAQNLSLAPGRWATRPGLIVSRPAARVQGSFCVLGAEEMRNRGWP
jgi:hypothetical protein